MLAVPNIFFILYIHLLFQCNNDGISLDLVYISLTVIYDHIQIIFPQLLKQKHSVHI